MHAGREGKTERPDREYFQLPSGRRNRIISADGALRERRPAGVPKVSTPVLGRAPKVGSLIDWDPPSIIQMRCPNLRAGPVGTGRSVACSLWHFSQRHQRNARGFYRGLAQPGAREPRRCAVSNAGERRHADRDTDEVGGVADRKLQRPADASSLGILE